MFNTSLDRRRFLEVGAMGGLGLVGRACLTADELTASLPPARAITRGPKFHWFGYYDKLEFDPTNRYVLGMEVGFEHRSPKPMDVVHIGMVDLADGDRWIKLGESCAWCWQQGCMLQWIPGTQSQVLWNDRDGDHFVCRILDVATRERRTIPHPIYTVHPDGKTALSTSFSRLADVRPGYGYAGVPDPYRDDPAPTGDGIWHEDLQSGEHQLLLSIAQVASFGKPLATMVGAKHKFNHLLYNTDGSRFSFLHRWTGPKGRETRMLTAKPDGSDLRVVDDNGLTSHYWWRDPRHILALSSQPSHGVRFYLFEDGGDRRIDVVGEKAMTVDGHVSYLPGNKWILNDTYPQGGYQHPYLYQPATDRKVALGRFAAPAEYTGEWRCDTHPRFSRDGNLVVIDAPEQNSGRQLNLIEISGLVS
jgi:hypothetical protein